MARQATGLIPCGRPPLVDLDGDGVDDNEQPGLLLPGATRATFKPMQATRRRWAVARAAAHVSRAHAAAHEYRRPPVADFAQALGAAAGYVDAGAGASQGVDERYRLCGNSCGRDLPGSTLNRLGVPPLANLADAPSAAAPAAGTLEKPMKLVDHAGYRAHAKAVMKTKSYKRHVAKANARDAAAELDAARAVAAAEAAAADDVAAATAPPPPPAAAAVAVEETVWRRGPTNKGASAAQRWRWNGRDIWVASVPAAAPVAPSMPTPGERAAAGTTPTFSAAALAAAPPPPAAVVVAPVAWAEAPQEQQQQPAPPADADPAPAAPPTAGGYSHLAEGPNEATLTMVADAVPAVGTGVVLPDVDGEMLWVVAHSGEGTATLRTYDGRPHNAAGGAAGGNWSAVDELEMCAFEDLKAVDEMAAAEAKLEEWAA